jgi:hypothetical protein
MQKISRDQRAAKFRTIGQLSENQRAWRDHLGDHQFEPVVKAVADKSTESRYEPCAKPCCAMLIRSEGGVNSHFPGAPITRTWQLERTVRRSA